MAVASLECVMAGWLRPRRLTVASVGAGRGCGGFRPRHLPRQGGGSRPGVLLPGGGRLNRRGWGKALAPLRGELPSVFGACVGLVLGGAELYGVGAVQL